MRTVDIEAAEIHLSQLIDAAVAGEDVVIARGDTPVVRLVPLVGSARKPIELGTLAGRLGKIPENFDAPLPDDVLDDFEGR